MALPIRYNHQIKNSTEIWNDSEELIESLADLAGFEVYKVLDENSRFVGYVTEATDKELREFLAVEDAEEQNEIAVLGSFDCYFEEEA